MSPRERSPLIQHAAEQILRLEPTLYVNCYPSQSDGQFIIRMTPGLQGSDMG